MFVLEEACRQLNRWAEILPDKKPTIDVNLSSRQFRDPNFLTGLAELLAKWKISPDQLRLEISEAAVNPDPDAAPLVASRAEADLESQCRPG